MRQAAPSQSHQPLFREVQRFCQTWIWIVIVPLATIVWLAAFRQWVQGQSTDPAPSWVLPLVWLLCGVGIPILFSIMRLITEVREDGIYVRFIPFHFHYQRFPFSDLTDFEDRTYRPILEYGGWGIRCSFQGKGRAYNVSGNRGVQLVFKNGKRLLIGSQRSPELCQSIRTALEGSVC